MIILKNPRLRLIHISRCRGISRKNIWKLLKYDSSLINIYRFSPLEISKFLSIPEANARLFYHDLHDGHLLSVLKSDLSTYHVITIVDEHYPSMINTIKDKPIVIYAYGDVSLLTRQPTISVIGTRNPSKEARSKIDHILTPLVDDGWIVVSGMAKGIDSFAHELALGRNGKTIAVLGSGFKHIYPRQNTSLFHHISNHGLVISEYPPNIPPKKYHFPERNRIISGLSFGTLVIEATEKSGTLITVGHALDQGREVYAIPGSPLTVQSKGCHQLIQDGAKLVIDAQDIKDDWELFGKNHLLT